MFPDRAIFLLLRKLFIIIVPICLKYQNQSKTLK